MNFPTNLTNLHACFWHVLSFGVNIDIFPLNWGTSCDGISVLPYLIDIKENHISESIFAQVTFKKFMVTHVYPQANKDWKKLRYACLDLEMLKTFLDTSRKKCCFMYSSFVVNMIKLSGICCYGSIKWLGGSWLHTLGIRSWWLEMWCLRVVRLTKLLLQMRKIQWNFHEYVMQCFKVLLYNSIICVCGIAFFSSLVH